MWNIWKGTTSLGKDSQRSQERQGAPLAAAREPGDSAYGCFVLIWNRTGVCEDLIQSFPVQMYRAMLIKQLTYMWLNQWTF